MNSSADWFIKPVTDPPASCARIDWLRSRGIPTPEAVLAGPSHIAIRRIAGRDGRSLLDPAAPHAWLGLMLAASERIHALPAHDLELPDWDPGPLIEPRLDRGGHLARRGKELWQRTVGQLPRGGDRLIHGDFHPGQLLLEPDGRLWIIDWDDLARGHPAVDRLNLLVYVSSVADFAQPLWQMRPDWAPCDATERAIARALLLRRALKLAERDPLAARPAMLVDWAEDLAD